jgi:dTDP-4-keto-6-deoxy-L-hexose2,3-dehydratase
MDILRSNEEILSWIEEKNKNLKVLINKKNISETNWFLDEDGVVRNKDNTFFQIKGIKRYNYSNNIIEEQPILIQDEIGYLGIICKEFDETMFFLMQAKIEPGNVNKIQISPTIQATKSNFTQKHGGKKPAYLEYFLNADRYKVLVDQIQSEQSSRFLGKRNRNIIVLVDEEIEVLSSHMWMTLKQIKELMKIDNLVNMDTRTVLSCIPYLNLTDCEKKSIGYPKSDELKKSLYQGDKINHITQIYRYINDYKMFDDDKKEIISLNNMKNWKWKLDEFCHKERYHFKVIFCEIEIEGREVKKWTQPLFEAVGKAVFGLITCIEDDMLKFLVKAVPEIGCFDKIELAPTIQLEAGYEYDELNYIDKLFFDRWKNKNGVIFDTILSEEGGRFYHEQNHNIILNVNKDDIRYLPDNYFWVDYKTLVELIKINNVLNIQLRNLLSVLEA